MKVLITNGDYLIAYNVLKALAACDDIEVHVSAEKKFSPCLLSKFCAGKLINTPPRLGESLFVNQISTYVNKHDIDVLIPINPRELELILRNRGSFDKHLSIPFVEHRLLEKLNDKWQFCILMNQLSIPTPFTVNIKSLEELETIELAYPVIIKPRIGAGSAGVRIANNQSELHAEYENLIKKKSHPACLPIVQQFIQGQIYGVGAICSFGKVRSVFVYKSLREYNITFGTSTSRISVHDTGITESAIKILEHLQWHGVAHFDVIKADRNYFLEMNPRIWLSISLPVSCGLNYPFYLCKLDKDPVIPSQYVSGVIQKIILSDTQVFLKSLFSKKKYPLSEFFTGSRFDDFHIQDPWPAIYFLMKALQAKQIY